MLKHAKESPIRQFPFSSVRSLLAIPSIGSAGVERSIVFGHLPANARAQVHAAATEREKVRLAVDAGDCLPIVKQMHAHYVSAPEQRRQAGLAFPRLCRLRDYPLPGVLQDSDRGWLRPDHCVQAVVLRKRQVGWIVEVHYADGMVCSAPTAPETLKERRQARGLQVRILRTAWILGMWGNSGAISAHGLTAAGR